MGLSKGAHHCIKQHISMILFCINVILVYSVVEESASSTFHGSVLHQLHVVHHMNLAILPYSQGWHSGAILLITDMLILICHNRYIGRYPSLHKYPSISNSIVYHPIYIGRDAYRY